jgi:pyruvate-formate lyase
MTTEIKSQQDWQNLIDEIQLSPRLTRLKDAMFSAPRKISVDRARLAMQSWQESEGEDIEIRRAKLLEKVLLGVPIAIYDFDLIVGRETEQLVAAPIFADETGDAIPGLWDDVNTPRLFKNALTPEQREVVRECSRFFAGKTAPDHVMKVWRELTGTWADDITAAKGADPTPDSGYYPGITCRGRWEAILGQGLKGMIAEAENNLRRFKDGQETDINKYYFWQSAIIVCRAAVNYSKRYARLAESLAAKEKDPQRKKELETIVQACDWVPENPARTFQEAVQSVNIIMVVRGLEAMYPILIGRLDQYLRPYYEKDLAAGRLTRQQALDILGNALTLWGMKVVLPTGKTQQETHQFSFSINSVNLGGVDRQGRDAASELSYMVLHTIGLLKMSSPTVLVNWHANSPHWLVLKALETNMKTKGGIPLFENSDHVVKCFVKDGVDIAEARDWYGQGCVTPILPSKIDHNGAEGKGAVNIALMLDLALHRGVSQITGQKVGIDVGDPRHFQSFADLYQAFQKECQYVVKKVLWLGTVAQSVEPQYLRFPFNSCIAGPHCLQKGHDILITDADHSYGISDRAIIDCADSLTAIKHLVYDTRQLTMDELMNALDSNFANPRGEEIRQLCLASPKYGNDNDAADQMAKEVGIFSGSVLRSYINPFDVPVKISREGLSWHYFGGLGVGALADGRKSLEPLNDGSMSPMRGMDKLGPTGVMRSALKAGFNESYASCLNQKFSWTIMQSPESREKLAILTETFFKNGGQHIQYNMVDTAELKDAKVHPEKHRDLVVRVGGFSAYFVMLSSEIQDDIIYRSEQGC